MKKQKPSDCGQIEVTDLNMSLRKSEKNCTPIGFSVDIQRKFLNACISIEQFRVHA